MAQSAVVSRRPRPSPGRLRLENGSRVAVVGCGPAGSLFAYFLLELAARLNLCLQVDLFEPKQFARPGPQGCNMCGGVVSELLVQNFAAEGISLPPDVVQRGIDSYVLHLDVGRARIVTPRHEMGIAAVHRGGGPRDVVNRRWGSFDDYLLHRAIDTGARLVPLRVEAVFREQGKPALQVRGGDVQAYDLLAAAVGVNSPIMSAFEGLGIGYERPGLSRTFIGEYRLGSEVVRTVIGSSMHVFLLDIPGLEFAAIIPKGEHVTMCLLGEGIDRALVDAFVTAPEVRACMPPGWDPARRSCQCMPYISVRGVPRPCADRFLFIGDCGVTRLYKDGIGAAYRTAKAAARAAVFDGISEKAFARHYLPVCQRIAADNRVGRAVFAFTRIARRSAVLRRALLRMSVAEQRRDGPTRRLSAVLWDLFSGSAPYSNILRRMLHPTFVGRFMWSVAVSAWPANRSLHEGARRP